MARLLDVSGSDRHAERNYLPPGDVVQSIQYRARALRLLIEQPPAAGLLPIHISEFMNYSTF